MFDRVSVNIKVLKVIDSVTHLGGKTKQDVFVADATTVKKCTLWEDQIGTLQEHASYWLKNFIVREYASEKFLSLAKDGSEIETICDIGHTATSKEVVENDDKVITNAQIVGVPLLDKYKACLRCKARVEPSTPPFGRCSKPECAMMQRYDVCQEQLSAKFLFMTNSNFVSLYAYGKIVKEIAGEGDSVTEEMLLQAPLITITYNNQNMITAFVFNTQ